jgi:hypothetical protein
MQPYSMMEVHAEAIASPMHNRNMKLSCQTFDGGIFRWNWVMQSSYLASCVRSSIISTSGESGTRDHVHKAYGRETGVKGTSAKQDRAFGFTKP